MRKKKAPSLKIKEETIRYTRFFTLFSLSFSLSFSLKERASVSRKKKKNYYYFCRPLKVVENRKE